VRPGDQGVESVAETQIGAECPERLQVDGPVSVQEFENIELDFGPPA
jgi:hypothetical protein